ncbi:MAG: hypothetical protein JWN65_1586 [Solirubrobacterales bacterium]|jgi:hypothetical protein|nr:hypothetical protein [Solirubrobacterales bacterium]
MYMSIRTYRVGRGSIDDMMHRVDTGLADAFAQEPGFAGYEVAQMADDTITSITMFQTESQAAASNDLAARWVAEELAEFEIERTGVWSGKVRVSRATADILEPAHA